MRLVLKGDGLVRRADHNLVLTDNVAHSDRVDADLLARTLALTASAAVDGRLGASTLRS